MKAAKEIALLPRIYDLLLWFAPKLSQFPRKYKYTLGDRINNLLLDMLEMIK